MAKPTICGRGASPRVIGSAPESSTTYFLALVYRVLDDSTTTVRFIQALIGAGSCALVAAAGISLYGRRGAIAGIGLAIYPPALFLDGLIEKSPPIKLASETAARNLRAARLVSREYRHIAMTPGMHSIPAHQRSSTAPPTRKARTPSIGRRLLHMVDHQEFPRRLGVHQFQPILLLDRREDCRAGVA